MLILNFWFPKSLRLLFLVIKYGFSLSYILGLFTRISFVQFFFFFWEQRLRFLLKKELKNSDVGSLGRIVLPKVRCSLSLSICAQVFFLFFYFYYSIITVSGKGI